MSYSIPLSCLIIAIIFSLAQILGPTDQEIESLLSLFNIMFTVAGVISAYMFGYTTHREQVYSINVVHTLSNETKKVRITEFDNEGAIIKTTELQADPRWQSGFSNVISHVG